MSLCVCLQKPNEIYIAGDSRVSVKINNQKYRWHDNYCKVHQIDNMVVFIGGQEEIMRDIINKFKESDDRTLEVIRTIAETEFNRNYTVNNTDDMIVSMIIATFIDDQPLVYFIGDRNNFEIMKIELGSKEYQDIILGCRCEEAIEVFDYDNFRSDDFNDIFDAYQSIYSYTVNEEVGGELTVYKLTKDTIEQKSCTLKNPDNIRQYQTYLTCNALYIGNSQVNALINNKISDDFVNIRASTINALSIVAGSVSASNITAGTITSSISINSPTINGGTITGGTIQTASSGNRIVLSNNSLRTYNYNTLNGIVWGNGSGGDNFGDVLFYDQGTCTMKFYNTLAGGGWNIYAPSGSLGLGAYGTDVLCLGNWNFNNAIITGIDLDYKYCKNSGNQKLSFQIYDDNLEVFENGTYKGRLALS